MKEKTELIESKLGCLEKLINEHIVKVNQMTKSDNTNIYPPDLVVIACF